MAWKLIEMAKAESCGGNEMVKAGVMSRLMSVLSAKIAALGESEMNLAAISCNNVQRREMAGQRLTNETINI